MSIDAYEAKLPSVAYALLGMLAREPLSGYDIARQLRTTLGFFWAAPHSQIYPELARLEARALVTHARVEQTERPDKKIYSITPAGRDALARWVVLPPLPTPVRDELLLKTFSVWLADRPQAVALFQDQARAHARQLAEYQAFARVMQRECGPALQDPGSAWFATYATLQRGIGTEQSAIEWCEWVADQLVARPESVDQRDDQPSRPVPPATTTALFRGMQQVLGGDSASSATSSTRQRRRRAGK
jgi:DNA-binding PadR family transcriptional regulator